MSENQHIKMDSKTTTGPFKHIEKIPNVDLVPLIVITICTALSDLSRVWSFLSRVLPYLCMRTCILAPEFRLIYGKREFLKANSCVTQRELVFQRESPLSNGWEGWGM